MRERGERGKVALDGPAAFERHGADHALQHRIVQSVSLDPPGLVEVTILGGIDFDEHQALDRQARSSSGELVEAVLPVQERDSLHPWVGDRLRIIEMHMGVDDRTIGHARFSQ